MKYDIIIVLGYAVYENGELKDIGKWRVEKAIELYKNKENTTILMCGGFGEHFNQTKYSLAYWMKKYAIKLGAKSKDILLEEESKNTIEDALYALKIVKKRDWKSICIITSDLHFRAKKIFKQIFKDYNLHFIYARTRSIYWFFFQLWWEFRSLSRTNQRLKSLK